MQSQTTLVRAEGRVELDAETTVYLELTLVVFPDHAEVDDALGYGGDFEGSAVFGVFLEEGGVFEGGGELWEEEEKKMLVRGFGWCWCAGLGWSWVKGSGRALFMSVLLAISCAPADFTRTVLLRQASRNGSRGQ